MINKTHADIRIDHQLIDFTHIVTLFTGDVLDILHKVETVGRDTQGGRTTPEEHAGINAELQVLVLFQETELIAHAQIGFEAVRAQLDAEITVIIGEMAAGADVSDVFAGIELNGEGAACRIDRWYYDESDKARPIVITAPIPENYRGYYDVGFYLPEGVALADAVITVDAPNCTSYEIGEGEFSSKTQTDVLVRVYFDLSK